MIRGYRVWDNQEKIYSDKAFSIGQLGICYVQDEDGHWEEIDDSRFIVEFETGLTDKNAHMICEGDIVALLFGYVPMKSVTTENIRIENAQKAVIHFDAARAAFRYTIKLRTPKDCQFKPGTKTNMVVIGNVHENKEFLDG